MYKIMAGFWLLLTLTSCARMSIPTGGPKDITSPLFISATPKTLSVNIDSEIKEIVLNFNEYIILKDISKQVVISPSPKILPNIQPTAIAKKSISIKFHEPLNENTTYNINFGSSIQDNNEGNKLDNFSYTFSTGPEIDSLYITGNIKKSLDNNLPSSIIVSLFKVNNDSIDTHNKPYYITRTDSENKFHLKYLSEGEYRLIAFNDLNSNLIIDSDKENIGFYNQTINPKDLGSYDIILSPAKLKYKTKNIEQEGQGILKFKFQGNPEDISISPLDQNFPEYSTFHSKYADSLYLYFNNGNLEDFGSKNRMNFLVKYKNAQDTLSVFYDNNKKTELILSLPNKEVTPSENFSLNANNFLKAIDFSKIEILRNKESVNFSAHIDSVDTRNLKIDFPVTYNSSYRVKIKAEAITDFLNQTNKDSLTYDINVKKANEYGNLTLFVKNKPSSNFFFQLLNDRKEIEKNIYGNYEFFEFKDIKPGKYLIRILVDENNNGFWDPADLQKFIPAEKTFLYPTPIEVRAFWNINETWTL